MVWQTICASMDSRCRGSNSPVSWFRMHTDIIHHPVVACLPAAQFKAWVQMLCLAKIGDGEIPKVSEIAFHLRCGVGQAIKLTDELVNDYGLLVAGTDGTFRPKNWDKHQYKSDNVTERVRAFRKRRGNVSETAPETETETETETEQSRVQIPRTISESEETRKNAIVEAIIRSLAQDQPDPQDFEAGIDAAIREILSSANPEITVTTMQANIPLWWEAMRDGRARVKPMRFVIVDRDYLRTPKKAAGRTLKRRDDGLDEVFREAHE